MRFKPKYPQILLFSEKVNQQYCGTWSPNIHQFCFKMKLKQPRYTLINPSRHLWWAHIVDSLLQKLSRLGTFKHVIYLLHFIESPHSVFMTVGINCFKVCLKIKAISHTSAFSYLLAQKAGAGSAFWFRKLLHSSRSVKTHFFGSCWARRCWLEVSSALPGSPESAYQNSWLLCFSAMELQDPPCGAFALWVPVTMKSMILPS